MQGIQQWAFSQEHAERLSLGYEQVLHDSQLWQMALLNDIARRLNGRPRKTLGWKTPEEALAEEMVKFNSTVALDS